MTDFWMNLAGWWPRAALVGAVTLLLGYLAMRTLRSLALRQHVGAWTIRATLLGAIICLFPAWVPLPRPESTLTTTPPPPIAVLEPQTKTMVADELPLPPSAPMDMEPVVVAATETPVLITANSTAPALDWVKILGQIALIGYGLLMLTQVLRLGLGQLVLWRLGQSMRTPPEVVAELFAQIAAERGITRLPRLGLSHRVTTPICFGLFRPTVIVPERLVHEADVEGLSWVFAHELDHLQRGDPWTGWWLAWVQAVYFFVPWFWWLRHEQRLAQEFLADAAAVRGLPDVAEYADFLVQLSCRRQGTAAVVPLGATGVRAGSTDLYRRVRMLLNHSSKSTSPATRPSSRLWRFLTAGMFVGLAVLLGGVGLQSGNLAAQETEDPPAAPEAPEPPKPPKIIILNAEGDQEGVEKKLNEAFKKAAEALQQAGQGEAAEAMKKALEAQKEAILKLQKQGMFKLQENLKGEQFKALQEQLKEMRFDGQQIEQLKKQLAEMNVQFPQEELQKQLEQLKRRFPQMKNMPPLQFRFGNEGNFEFPRLQQLQIRSKPRLGLQLESPSQALREQLEMPKDQGLVITNVLPNTPAAKAGVKPYDILLELADQPVSSDQGELLELLNGLESDKAISAVVLRKGRKVTLEGIKLAKKTQVRVQNAPANRIKIIPKPPKPPVVPGRIKSVPKPPKPPVVPAPAAPIQSSSSMSVQVGNDGFQARYSGDGITVNIRGTVENGKAKPTDIRIKDGDTTVEVNSLDKVPAKYKELIENKIMKSFQVS